jgi:hypothetical protein
MIPRSRLVAAYAAAAQHYASAGNVEATMENLVAMILVEIATIHSLWNSQVAKMLFSEVNEYQ